MEEILSGFVGLLKKDVTHAAETFNYGFSLNTRETKEN